MHPGFLILLSVPWKELIVTVPKVMDAAAGLYETMRGMPRRRPPRGTSKADGIPTLRADVTELQERLDTLEDNNEAQAELITQMTRHAAGLLRWLIVLALTSLVAGIIAIAAIVVAVLQ